MVMVGTENESRKGSKDRALMNQPGLARICIGQLGPASANIENH
jgi:hypothetical protein